MGSIIYNPTESNVITNDNNLSNYNKELQKVSANQPTTAALTSMMKGYTDNVNSFRPFSGGDPTPFIGGMSSAYEARARNQSPGWLIGHSAAQFFLGEMAGGTVSGVGTLVRPDKWVERVAGTDDAFQKTLIEELGNWIQETTSKTFPIYQTQKAQKGVALGDATWYASMMPTVASAISILLPARAAAFLPTKIARLVAEGNVFTKATKIADKTGELAKISTVTKAEHWTTIASAALAGRVIDSTRESLNKYDEYYQEFLGRGISPFEAQREAAEAAAKGFRMSHANIVFDLVEWGTMLKMGNYLNKSYVNSVRKLLMKYDKAGAVLGKGGAEVAAKALRAELALDVLKTGLAEGTDEMTMDIFQNEGKYQYDVQHNLVPETNFEDRLAKHLTTRKSWDSFIGGAVGGLFFMLPYGSVIEKVTNKKGIERQKTFVDSLIKNAEANKKIIEQIDEAIVNNDPKLATTLKDQLILNLASKSFANGTLEYDKAMLHDMARKSPEQLKEQGINSDISSYISDIIDSVDKISNIYQNEIDNVRLRDDNGKVHSANFAINMAIAESKAKIELYRKRKEQFAETDEYKTAKKDLDELESSLTDVGKAYFETLLTYAENDKKLENRKKSIEDAIKVIERQMVVRKEASASGQGRFSKFMDDASIKSQEKTIQHLKDQIKIIEDSRPDIESERKLALKAFEAIDNNGNPVLSQDLKTKIETRLNDIKTQSANKIALDKYDELDQVIEVEKAVLEFKSTKEGMEMMKDFHIESTKDLIEKQKATIEKELAGKSLKDLKEMDKLYNKRTDIPVEIWSPILKAKIAEAERVAKVKDQNSANANIGANKSASNSTQGSSVDVSPLVEGSPTVHTAKVGGLKGMPNVTITLKGKATNAEIVILSQQIIEEVTKSITADSNITEDERKALIADRINEELHFIGILNMFLSEKNRKILLPSHHKLNGATLTEIYNSLKGKNLNNPSNNLERVAAVVGAFAADLARQSQIAILPDNTIVRIGEPLAVFDGEFIQDIIALSDSISHNGSLYQNIQEEFEAYMEDISKPNESYSELFKRIDNEIPDDENDNVRKRTASIIMQNVSNELANNLKTIDNVLGDENEDSLISILNANRTQLKDLLRYIKYVNGGNMKVIKKEDVYLYLRDNNLLPSYRKMFHSIDIFLSYIKLRISQLKAVEAMHIASVTAANAEIDSLKKILNLFQLGEINDNTVNDDKLRKFKEQYGATYEKKSVEKPGIAAVLNLKDSKGNDISLPTRGVIESDEDLALYGNINNIVAGAEVVFEQVFDATNPDRYIVPIKINLKNPNKDTTPTILSLRDMNYISGGIQYGRKTDKGYRFFGISEVMTNSSYSLLANNFEMLRDFYYHYRQARYKNLSEYERGKHEKDANKLFDLIYSNSDIKELLLRVMNQNVETSNKITVAYAENLVSILDAVFFNDRVEKLGKDKEGNESQIIYGSDKIKYKITARDKRYEKDYQLTKGIREAIDNGTLKESKISYVSIPTVLSIDEPPNSFEPRETLDEIIKPIKLEGENSSRIVLIQYDKKGNKYIDLKTGEEFKDSRFDTQKYEYQSSFLQDLDPGIRVLLQAPNGTIIPYNAQVNTLGRSFQDESHREKARSIVANALYESLLSEFGIITNETISDSLHALSNIVINDSSVKRNENSEDKNYGFLSRYADENSARLTIVTIVDGERVFVNIVRDFKDNTISFYQSERYLDIMVTNANRESKRSFVNKYTSDRDINIAINEDNKLYIYEKMLEISNNMLRQPAIDYGKTPTDKSLQFRHNLIPQSDGRLYDELTDETYEDAQDYYIRTGALFTFAGYVKDSNGDVLTNFDLKGRFPFSVHIAHTDKDFEPFVAKNLDELIGKNKLLSEDDPMIDLISYLDEEVGSNISEIAVTNERHPTNYDAIASISKETIKEGPNKGKYKIKVYSPYQSEKRIGDIFRHASANIAHEYLHTYIYKKYDINPNETAEERKDRISNILYHNKVLTQYISELKTHWDGISKSDKLLIVAKALNTDNSVAKIYSQMFNDFISKIVDDANKINAITSKMTPDSNIGYDASIQEVLTYSYTTPFVALILNGLDTANEYKSESKKSFWDLLVNKLFSILSRLFRTSFDFNSKSELAKLTHLVNNIFDTRLRDAAEQDFTKIEPASEIQSEESSEVKPEESSEDTSENNDEDDLDIDTSGYVPFTKDDFSETFTQKTSSSNIEESIMSQIAGVIDNPEEYIRDAENLPIC